MADLQVDAEFGGSGDVGPWLKFVRRVALRMLADEAGDGDFGESVGSSDPADAGKVLPPVFAGDMDSEEA